MRALIIKEVPYNIEVILPYLNNTEDTIIYTEIEHPIWNDFEVRPPSISEDEKSSINYSAMQSISEFGDHEIYGLSLTEYLKYQEMPVWQYNKFRVYFLLRNIQYIEREIEHLKSTYDEIIVVSSLPMHVLGEKNNDKVKYVSTVNHKINKKKFIQFALFAGIRWGLGFFQRKATKLPNVILDRYDKQAIIDPKTLETRMDNASMSYLFDECEDRFLVIDDPEPPKFNNNIPFRLKKHMFVNTFRNRNRIFGEHILIQALFSRSLKEELRQFDTIYNEKYNVILANCKNVDRTISLLLKSLHKSTLFFARKYLSYSRFFKGKSFNTIVTTDENSPSVRAILDAASYQNMKTIGIQHGNIHELHPAYIHTKNDIQQNIITDLTLVWGEKWKKFLVEKGNYPIERLITTGQIRTDIIPKIKGKTLESVKQFLPEDKNIIMFASQPQRDPELRRKAAYDIFKACAKLDDIFLVVKLHPREKFDFNYYENIAHKAGCSNFMLTYTMDLYALLAASKVVITCFSTVGAEAIYFDKPLIVVDYLKQDIQGFIKDKVGVLATNHEEIRENIKQYLSQDQNVDTTAYNEYIEENAYKIDGKVCKRIVSIIDRKSPSALDND
ncbi:MAG: UDP-N-acetylglucosamine 2-epimerase [Hyphomicrobiales bacterium]